MIRSMIYFSRFWVLKLLTFCASKWVDHWPKLQSDKEIVPYILCKQNWTRSACVGFQPKLHRLYYSWKNMDFLYYIHFIKKKQSPSLLHCPLIDCNHPLLSYRQRHRFLLLPPNRKTQWWAHRPRPDPEQILKKKSTKIHTLLSQASCCTHPERDKKKLKRNQQQILLIINDA